MAELKFSKTFTRITVNGQTYKSVEEMPPDVRQQYEKAMGMMADRNNNGIPDALEGVLPKDGTTVIRQVSTTQRMLDGSPTNLPPVTVRRASPFDQSGFDSSEDAGGIRLRWPTPIAHILTAAGGTRKAVGGGRRLAATRGG